MFEGLEKRVSKAGNISYWKDGEIVYKQCTGCREIKPVTEFGRQKKSDGYRERCKECRKIEKREYCKNNREKIREADKLYRETHKEEISAKAKRYRENNKDKIKERSKRYRENNKDKIRQYRENNKEKLQKYDFEYYRNNIEKKKEYDKRYVLINKEKRSKYYKEYYQNNKERRKECTKEWRRSVKGENIQNIKRIIEEINPILKGLPIYGYIYKVENTKTNKVYIGQSINPIRRRYGNDIIKEWIKERYERENQKFLDEMIEGDFKVTEVLDVGVCKWHLDKLESYYIDKYNSFYNGYNNTLGNFNTDDGIEEFENILNKHNLEFIDGELRRIV